MTTIYLDNSATTPLDPRVLEAMRPYLERLVGNPSSSHSAGRGARRAVDDAARRIAACLHGPATKVYFTSGATEANNLAIHSAVAGLTAGHVLVSPAEHPSCLEPVRRLARRGFTIEELALDTSGAVAGLPDRLRDDTRLVVVQLANSETGRLQDVRRLAESCPKTCWFHCDAAQAVGKVPVEFAQFGVTSLAVSGHKIHGPAGVGALLVRKDAVAAPLFFGGHQQDGARPGTEPVALIAGFATAVEIACQSLESAAGHLCMLRDRLEEKLLAELADVVRNGPETERLPNVSNLSFLGCQAEALLIALDLAGVCCSAGPACASGSAEPSVVLRAMGLEKPRLASALRFSVGRFNTAEEIDQAARRIAATVHRLRGAGCRFSSAGAIR